MLPKGIRKLTTMISKHAAWRDWNRLSAWCAANGHADLIARHAPPVGSGHTRVDKAILAVGHDLGVTQIMYAEEVLMSLDKEQKIWYP